jgi:hypothetical protein
VSSKADLGKLTNQCCKQEAQFSFARRVWSGGRILGEFLGTGPCVVPAYAEPSLLPAAVRNLSVARAYTWSCGQASAELKVYGIICH